MLEIKETMKIKKSLNANLQANYATALKDSYFNKLIQTEEIPDNVGMKYTSKLEDCATDLKKCAKCSGLHECKTQVEGHLLYPKKEGNRLIVSYIPCKHFKEQKALTEKKVTAGKVLENASMKDIDITDKKRVKVIKWIKEFYDKYEPNKKLKGLYLHGNFGCGKTYLIAALFNELEKKRVRSYIVYFPELLRTLKDDWDSYGKKIDYLCNVDVLLIDDIGAEKVTEWGRDEILGTILQSRMNNELATFFTSNLTVEELENHLTLTRNSDDSVKARRIIERVKHLSDTIELISENRRK